jgi:hypothetical protein
MINVRRKDKVRNEKIRKSAQVKDVSVAVRELKWKWAEHVARYPVDRLPNQVEAGRQTFQRKTENTLEGQNR